MQRQDASGDGRADESVDVPHDCHGEYVTRSNA